MQEHAENDGIAPIDGTEKSRHPRRCRFRLLVASLSPLPLVSRLDPDENAGRKFPRFVDCQHDAALKKFLQTQELATVPRFTNRSRCDQGSKAPSPC
jgi:hypothetical protein